MLASAASATVAAIAPAAALAAPRRWNMATIDLEVAREAKRIGTGGKPLSLLLPNGSQANVFPVLDAFFAASGIRVDHQVAPVDDIVTMMLLEATKDTATFDLALPATFGVPELAEAGAIHELDAFDATYLPQRYFDDVIFRDGNDFKGKHYGFQTDGDAYLLFALKSLLDDKREQEAYATKFGRRLKFPTTWSELDRQLEFFHRPHLGRYGGALFRTPEYIVWEWWLRFHAKGRFPVDEQFRPQIASDEGIEALEDLKRATSFLHPKVKEAGLFENWEIYKEGKTFLNIGWGGTQKAIHQPGSKVRGDLVHGPTPGLDEKVPGRSAATTAFSYFNWGWSYTVSKTSKFPDVAYLLALFASSPKQSLVAVRPGDGFFDPFRRQHYKDQIVKDAYGKDFLDAHLASRDALIPDFYVSAQGEFFGALRESLADALSGRKTSRVALEVAADRWRQIARRVGQGELAKQWKFLRQSYPGPLAQVLK